MQHVIDRILSEPVIVILLIIAFSLSMLAFFSRIRRDEKARRDRAEGGASGPATD
jgi:hypothetical protein